MTQQHLVLLRLRPYGESVNTQPPTDQPNPATSTAPPPSLAAPTFRIHGDPGPLWAALAQAQTEFSPLRRTRTVRVATRTGGAYEFAYAPLDEVLAAVLPALGRNGLALAQPLTDENGRLGIRTLLTHASGAYLESVIVAQPSASIQETGSQITYLRRYAVQALLGLAAEEDDDANAAAGHQAEIVRDQPRPPTPKPTKRVGEVVIRVRGKPGRDDQRQAVMDQGLKWDPEAGVAAASFLPAAAQRVKRALEAAGLVVEVGE